MSRVFLRINYLKEEKLVMLRNQILKVKKNRLLKLKNQKHSLTFQQFNLEMICQ